MLFLPSCRLVFDRESGKPKGYGFCEYKDQETALSAMRNLNGYEIGGRTLRVDNACTEKSRMEMQQLLQGPQVENPYGDPCDPENAPEVITKTVTSLPPEQMFELMKQMKACITNNPVEARQMLLLNPQLAYALLQAQVVMRIVDPATAVTMLSKPNQMPNIITNQSLQNPISNMGPAPIPGLTVPFPNQDIDLRSVDPRLQRNMDQDLRGGIPPGQMGGEPNFGRGGARPVFTPSDPRQRNMDPRVKAQGAGGPPNRGGPGPVLPTADTSDQEKAALIMQVLQLSDEQIAILPPEQRASILVLKEQISKSTQQQR